MGLYQQNLARLKKIDPEIANSLDALKEKNIEVIIAKNNMPTIKVITPEKEVYVHSTYNPGREAVQWADNNPVKPGEVLFIFGLGFAYHVQELLNRVTEDVKLVIVEPNLAILKIALEYVDLGYLLGRQDTYFIFGEQEVNFEVFLPSFVGFSKFEQIRFIDYSPIVRLAADYFGGVKERITKAVSNVIIEMNTMLRFSEEWINNLFENIPVIIASPGIAQLYGEFRDMPAIVVAAGPSLNKNISLLKQAKGKSIIICVGTALKPMLLAGIKPDIVISIDGGAANLPHFLEVSDEEIPLLFDITIYPEIPRTYKGPKLVGGCHEDLLRWVEKVVSEPKGLYVMGPSVANVAFDLARKLECNPIILVGQDLAYTGGMSHAKGTAYDYRTVKDFEDRGLFEVEGFDGEPVQTDRIMYSFLRWFEIAINSTKSIFRVIDATEGGAKIPGTQVMTLAEVIKEYCQFEVKAGDKIAEVFRAYTVPGHEEISRTIEEFEKLVTQLSELNNLGNKGVSASEQLYKLYQKGLPEAKQLYKILSELDTIDKQIEKYKETTDVLVLLFQKSILKVNQLSKQTDGESGTEKAKRVALNSMELYKGIAKVADNAQDMVAKTLKTLESSRDKEGV